jgi:hypothetical protein
MLLLAPHRSMVSVESEIAQPHQNYSEYVGGLDYGDDDMEGGDELPPVEMEMETEEVPMPLVQINSEYPDFFVLMINSEVFSL